MRTRKKGHDAMWYGLGMFGTVGWSVAVPTVTAAFVGVWIDYHWPSKYSWTLMLLLIGLIIGCWNAWYWVRKEGDTITREREENGNG